MEDIFFYKEKEEAILNKGTKYLFSTDLSEKRGYKKFFLQTHDEIYENIRDERIKHVYENIEEEQIKLFLDIDLKQEEQGRIAFDKLIDEILDLMTEQLKKINVYNPRIIILGANTSSKLSAHIIYPDIIFRSINDMKWFMLDIEHEYIHNKIIDVRVYKRTCLRTLYSSKMGKNNELKFYRGINYENIQQAYIYTSEEKDKKQLFFDTLILHGTNGKKTIEYALPEMKQKQKRAIKIAGIKEIINDDNDIDLTTISKYVKLLDVKRANDYQLWIDIGMQIYNCNTSGLEIWKEFSKQSEKYEEGECEYYWTKFIKISYNGIGSLKFNAKKDNPEGYETEMYDLEKRIYEAINIDRDYMLDKDDRISNGKTAFTKIVKKWMEYDEFKILAIQSAYNTGKTTFLMKLIEEYNIKRVLFISYRRTLTYDVFNNFKRIGFTSYLDKKYKNDKIICQVDSLTHIPTENINGLEVIKTFDLIIMDECESILYHYNSTTLKQKEYVYDLMYGMIKNSKKLLMMDGDFANRSYVYGREFGEVKVIMNKKKKNQKHVKLVRYIDMFNKSLDDDLKQKMRICLVTMSSTMATEYYEKYKDMYKCKLYCNTVDDKEIAKLINVNDEWSRDKCDLLIYSPIVEAGVNYDADSFDKAYCILCNKSTTPRALLQMLSRVRNYTNNEIMMYTNHLPIKQKANFYRFEEMQSHILKMHDKYLPKIHIEDKELGKMIVSYKYTSYVTNLIYNEVETCNKMPYYFIAYLIKMLVEKGHTYEIMRYEKVEKDENASGKKNKRIELINEFMKIENINKKTYGELCDKKKRNECTKEDKQKIDKYKYKLEWKLDEITKEHLDKFYGKTEVLRNLKMIKGESNYKIEENYYKEIKNIEKVNVVKNVICDLGYDISNINLMLKREDFEKNTKNIIKKNRLFIDENVCKLFDFHKTEIKGINTKMEKNNKSFMGFINKLLKSYGIKIKSKNKKKRIKGEKDPITEYYYKLQYNDGIDKYI